jgi:hypothetical protein
VTLKDLGYQVCNIRLEQENQSEDYAKNDDDGDDIGITIFVGEEIFTHVHVPF